MATARAGSYAEVIVDKGQRRVGRNDVYMVRHDLEPVVRGLDREHRPAPEDLRQQAFVIWVEVLDETYAMPVSGGSAASNSDTASSPPADAAMPATGKVMRSRLAAEVDCHHAASGRFTAGEWKLLACIAV